MKLRFMNCVGCLEIMTIENIILLSPGFQYGIHVLSTPDVRQEML